MSPASLSFPTSGAGDDIFAGAPSMTADTARAALQQLLSSRGVREGSPTPAELDRLVAAGFDNVQALEAVSNLHNSIALLTGPPMSLRHGPAFVIVDKFGPGARTTTKRARPEDKAPVPTPKRLPQHSPLHLYSTMMKRYSIMVQAYLNDGSQDQSPELHEALLGTKRP